MSVGLSDPLCDAEIMFLLRHAMLNLRESIYYEMSSMFSREGGTKFCQTSSAFYTSIFCPVSNFHTSIIVPMIICCHMQLLNALHF